MSLSRIVGSVASLAGFSLAAGCGNDALGPLAVFKDTLEAPTALMLWPGTLTGGFYGEYWYPPGRLAVLSPGETMQASAVGFVWIQRRTSGLMWSDGVYQLLEWSSSDPSVAAIDRNGTITARHAGTTTIQATSLKNRHVTAKASVTVLAEPLRFSTLDVGNAGCGITAARTAYCWGAEPRTIGPDPDHAPFEASVKLEEIPEPVVAVSAGGSYEVPAPHIVSVCALGESGIAYCWGDTKRESFVNDSKTYLVPTPVPSGQRFKAIAVGEFSTCALDLAGSAYCWGYRLGETGPVGPFLAPVAVAGNLHFKSIAVGRRACGIIEDGTAYCWGDTPTPVPGDYKFVQVAVADTYTCGLSVDHDVYCWGTTPSGALGLGTGVNAVVEPTRVLGNIKFSSVSVGKAYDGALTCGLAVDGKGYCWGQNGAGQLGAGLPSASVSNAFVPTLVKAPGPFTSLVAGANQACGIVNGKTYCWGRVFGHRTTTPEVPTLMEGQGR